MIRKQLSMRVLHRYIGFFLAGVMAVYALSGFVLIFRSTDFLKKKRHITEKIAPGLSADSVGKAIKKRDIKFTKTAGDTAYFDNGTYRISTGEVNYTVKELPKAISALTRLHKANTNDPLYYFNVAFALALLFFVVSSFWMFRPSNRIFRKGVWFAIGGAILLLVMLYV